MQKVTIETLPHTKEILGTKRWEEERGAFVQIAYREEMRHLVMFEIKKGFSRGSHYHQKKEEVFYIFQGEIRAIFKDIDTNEREESVLGVGDKIRVRPRCGHVFVALEDTLVVEYSPQIFDPQDTSPIDLP